MRVYIAARVSRQETADAVSYSLKKRGLIVVSTWHDKPCLGEETQTALALKTIWLKNRVELSRADLVLVLAFEEGGREMWSEAALANSTGKTLFCVSRLGQFDPALSLTCKVFSKHFTSVFEAIRAIGVLGVIHKIQQSERKTPLAG